MNSSPNKKNLYSSSTTANLKTYNVDLNNLNIDTKSGENYNQLRNKVLKEKKQSSSFVSTGQEKNWSFLNAIDKDKNDTDRQDCLKMYNDYNKALIAKKQRDKALEQQNKEQEYHMVQNELNKFKQDMHNSSKIKKAKLEEMVEMNKVQKDE